MADRPAVNASPLIAKSRGRVPAARPILESMRRAGMYLSQAVLDRALKTVGE